MKEVSFSDALRFMFSGVIAYFYLYICDADAAKDILAPLGVIGIPIALLVVGTLIYLLYRPLIYERGITWLQDVFRFKGGENYRTHIKKRYRGSGIGSYQTQLIWFQVKERLKDHYSIEMKTTASGIHLTYLTAILAIPFAVWMFVVSNCARGWVFTIIFLIIFLSAFLRDRYYEDIEMGFLRSLDEKELDLAASKIIPNILPTNIERTDF